MAQLRQAHENLKTEHNDLVVRNQQLASDNEAVIEKYNTKKRDYRKTVQSLNDDLKCATAECGQLKRQHTADRSQIMSLTNDVDTARENLQTSEQLSQDEIARLHSELDSVKLDLQAEREKARKEIAQLHVQIRASNERSEKYRQMLIPASEKQVMDADLVHKFTSLRSRILALVRQTWALKPRPDVEFRRLPPSHQEFFLSRIPGSYDRLRYVVSAFLYQGIFEAPSYFLRNDHHSFEDHLQKLERHLFDISPNGNSKSPTAWPTVPVCVH